MVILVLLFILGLLGLLLCMFSFLSFKQSLIGKNDLEAEGGFSQLVCGLLVV